MRANSVGFIKFILIVSVLVSVTGCNNAQNAPRRAGRVVMGDDKAEDLLAADSGSWGVQEEDNDKALMDPLEAHMRARKQVNPNETAINRRYTSKKDANDLNNEHYSRVMKLSPGTMEDTQTIEEAASDSVAQEVFAENKPQKPNFIAPLPRTKPITIAQSEPAQEDQAQVQDQAQDNVPLPGRPPKSKIAFKPSYGLKTEELSEERVAVAAPEHEKISDADIAHIENLRVGEHPGKTRIVLDASAPADFSYEVEGKTLEIDFKGAVWDAQSRKKLSGNGLMTGYKAETGPNDAHLAISLREPAKVLGTQHYPPNSDHNYHRIVIDIAPL